VHKTTNAPTIDVLTNLPDVRRVEIGGGEEIADS